ncbi:MAG: type VI secretion system baseplate subunit TssK, partial [Candidatus Rokuibacteriota bacterium]
MELLEGDELRQQVPLMVQICEGLELHVASIPDSDLIKTARFVLAAKAQLQPERLQASLPTLIKIGPVERIRDL